MWHKPHVLNALADLLFVVGGAALLAVATVWLVRMPSLPVQRSGFAHELQHVRRVEVEQALPAALKNNFQRQPGAVRAALEKLPWVRRVEVRRVWPSRLEVQVEEHRPAARWEKKPGTARGRTGEQFRRGLRGKPARADAASLPVLHGPRAPPDLLKRYGEFVEAFRPVGLRPVQILLSPRLSCGCVWKTAWRWIWGGNSPSRRWGAARPFHRGLSGHGGQTGGAASSGRFALSQRLRHARRSH